jgi:hypothetical protein
VRAVLDPNVIISALLSPDGAPARAVRVSMHGEFELVVSPLLLEELGRALSYPKLRKRIEPEEAGRVVDCLGTAAAMATDPVDAPSIRSSRPPRRLPDRAGSGRTGSARLRGQTPAGAGGRRPDLLARGLPGPASSRRMEIRKPAEPSTTEPELDADNAPRYGIP